MKKNKGERKVIATEYPRYRLVIPCILCAYMILSLLVCGMGGKTTMLVITSICMVLWFIGERIFPDKVFKEYINSHNKYIYIFAGIFLLMTVLSEVCSSDYSYSNLVGESDSLYTILGYMVVFYMAYRYCYMEESQKMLKYTMVTIAVITVAMSVIEFLDVPVAALWTGSVEALAERNRVTLTFGNSNYYGGFCCMLIPFIMELWICSEEKVKKLLLIALNGSLICCVMMSKSTMAVYLMLFIIIGICVYEFKEMLKQWMYLAGFVAITALSAVLLNACSSGKMSELLGVSIGNSDAFDEEEQLIYEVEDIQIEGNRLVIEGQNSSFIMEYGDSIAFYDEAGNVLDIENDEGVIIFAEEVYKAISVAISYNQNVGMLYVEIDAGYKETIDFYIEDGEFKGVGADGSAIDDISGEYKEHILSRMFTGRGYIWLNTVSMLDEVVFIGKGCGNFVYNFKQYDYVGLLKSQGTHNVIIDRPHNMVLQYCVDIGIVGTVALFMLIGYVLMGWIRQRIEHGKDRNVLSVASYIAVAVFMVISLINDSLVILSPYMWILLGVNMSQQNKVNSNEIKNSKK